MPCNDFSSIFLIVSCLNMFSCGNPTDRKITPVNQQNVNPVGYDLSSPDRILNLPPALFEISGVSVIDSAYVACVQDENGIVFILDLKKNGIRDQITFHYAGDYEGIAKVNGSFYILRSDGTIFKTMYPVAPASGQQVINAGGPPANYEGLCYDRRNHRLLIVPKNNPERGPGTEMKHPVYGLDLLSGNDSVTEVLEFDLAEITRLAAEKYSNSADEDKVISLMVFDIGIHPLTNMLYVISAVNRMLFVFDGDGTIKYIEKLKPDLFNMPEGISFLDNGEMLISNEGRANPPTILLFKYIPG